MNTRHLVAAASIAGAVVIGLPAVAQAAPVVPAQAILAANEFPFGSVEYKVSSEIGAPPVKVTGDSSCERASYDLDKRLEGAKSTDAEAVRGSSKLEASVNDRPMADAMRTVFRVCGAELGVQLAIAPLPADLSRYNGFVFLSESRDSAIGVVDVRGAAVGVSVDGRGNQPADTDAFWQILRAQVAKVERQP
ncbi:hypothetical protein [Tsukamurella strandjordii]|uniref:DUF3558 domain-containing protein n=1 Tax=Tsukamurella strandjordii TaxID=147577 RepID=A0AA90SL14_9ACTN|nr:hypothetical protein [Tsukamurella strandjordii]MDP0397747.1 hypothetical protein [Tsukamurella strandjordii]